MRSYLLRGVAGMIMELPQYMYMRVAIAVHGGRRTLDDILESYDDMSLRRYTHASPTLFNGYAHAATQLVLFGWRQSRLDRRYLRNAARLRAYRKPQGSVSV